MMNLATAFGRIPHKTRAAVETLVVGLVASLGSVAFQIGINWLYQLVFSNLGGRSFVTMAWVSLVAISIAALFSGWLLSSACPEAAGSGIPQLKLAYWKDFGTMPFRIAWIKFIAGVVSIGGGLSLGREGPSVQIGSCLGSSIAGLTGAPKQRRRAAAAAGAAAGLAAAFNAPLASVAFVLEEILEDLNSAFLGSALLAAVIGAFVVHATIGPQPAFEIPRISEPTWRAYLLIPLVAGLAAASGLLFQNSTLSLRKKARGFKAIPIPLRLLAGGVATWAVGMWVYAKTGKLGVFSLGYDDLTSAVQGQMAWKIALALLAGKLFATVVCYGLGGSGGIFSPTLFFGGMAGAAIGGLSGHFLLLSPSDQILLAVCGMSACLGAVVQAPLTALLIIFEMTHQFSLVPGLMLAGLVSLVLTRKLGRPNFYEEILDQDGYHMKRMIPPRDLRTWQNLPVSAIANFSPVVLSDLQPEALAKVTAASGHARYPVVQDGKLTGVVLRTEIESSITGNRPAQPQEAASTTPETSVRDSQRLLIASANGILVVVDQENRVLGILTLHDLLRVQEALSEQAV